MNARQKYSHTIILQRSAHTLHNERAFTSASPAMSTIPSYTALQHPVTTPAAQKLASAAVKFFKSLFMKNRSFLQHFLFLENN
jgi:hypothetical protein